MDQQDLENKNPAGDAPVEGAEGEESEAGEGEESKPSSSQTETDYDALLEEERKNGPDLTKAQEAFKKREEKRKSESGEDEDADPDEEGDKPMTRKEMEAYLQKREQRIYAEANADRIDVIAADLAENDREKELIVEIHKNRVWPDGMTLKQQLQESHDIATARRLRAKNIELARAVQSKDSASKETASSHKDATEGVAPKLQADVAGVLKRQGFEYDNVRKVHKKKMPNGKTLYRDAKTKRTWLE